MWKISTHIFNNQNFNVSYYKLLFYMLLCSWLNIAVSDNIEIFFDNNSTDYNFENFSMALNHLQIVQPNFFQWLKTSEDYIPIFDENARKASSLLLKAMKSVFKEDSSEDRALKNLFNIIDSQDRRTSAVDKKASAHHFFKMQQMNYGREVSDKLGVSRKYISRLFKPNRKAIWYPQFKEICSLQNCERPGNVLNIINNILYEDCKKETQEERRKEKIKNLESIRNFFHQIDNNFEFQFAKDKDYNEVKDHIHFIISQSNESEAATIIRELEKVIYSLDFKTTNLQNKTMMMMEVLPTRIPRSCFLMSALEGHDFKHKEAIQDLMPVIYDMAFSSFGSVLCAYVNYEDNLDKLNDEIEEIKNTTQNIIKYIPVFLNESHENAWKDGYIKEAVIRAINDSNLLLKNYTQQALEAQARINLMGNPRYFHEISISNNAFDGICLKCNPNNCDMIKDHLTMVNIVITRFEKDDYNRMESAAKWWTDAIQGQIDQYLVSNGYRSPCEIADDLEKLLNISTIFRSMFVNQEWSVLPFVRKLKVQKSPNFDFMGSKQSRCYRRITHFNLFYDIQIDFLL